VTSPETGRVTSPETSRVTSRVTGGVTPRETLAGVPNASADRSSTDPIVVIGNFDGVHRGHRALLARAAAVLPGARLVAVTFEPHTMAVLRPDLAPARLTPAPRKAELLADAGVDEVVVIGFDSTVATWSPEEFIEHVLIPLHPAVIVVGDGFRFGHKAKGDVGTLMDAGFRVETIPVVEVDVSGHPTLVSSSAIRYALAAGEVEAAAELLGRPHRVCGVVVRGDQRGRALLGYPTANLPATADEAVPADGVYGGWLSRLDEPDAPAQPAAISVGSNPTFDGVDRRVESYVLDRDDLELYGVEIAVDFTHRIRGMVKFDAIEDLVVQMNDDVDRVRDLLTGSGTARRTAEA
jgi:riboflavin kinase/FMN adenylyltransferase